MVSKLISGKEDRKFILLVIATIAIVGLVLYLFLSVKVGVRDQQIAGQAPQHSVNTSNETSVKRPEEKLFEKSGNELLQRRNTSAAMAWSASFKNLRGEKPRLVAHRAAVSGKLSDVVAARWQQQFCAKFSKGGDVLLSIGIDSHAEQVAYFRKMQESCFVDSVQPSDTLNVKDAQGFGSSAAALTEAAAGHAIPDRSTRRDLLKRVLETDSLELLASVSRRLLVKEDIYDLGLPPTQQVDGVTDEIMLDLAIQIEACTQRGDCDTVALENIDCSLYKSCVKDLRDFPSKRIFGNSEEQTFFTKMAPTQDATTLRVRWGEITQFLQQLRRPNS